MQPRFSYLLRFVVKFLEVAGAGLASAIVAYLLAHICTPPAPLPPLVQVTAANEEMMRIVRDEHALLVELRKELDDQKKPGQAAAVPMSVPAPKPTKPTQAASSRNQKSERTVPVAPKPRMDEPLPIQPAVAVSRSLPKNIEPSPKTMEQSAAARPIRVAASTNGDGEWSPLGKFKQIPAWVLPGIGEAPRPPMPVGEVPQSAM